MKCNYRIAGVVTVLGGVLVAALFAQNASTHVASGQREVLTISDFYTVLRVFKTTNPTGLSDCRHCSVRFCLFCSCGGASMAAIHKPADGAMGNTLRAMIGLPGVVIAIENECRVIEFITGAVDELMTTWPHLPD